jgi:hypothetical protein
VQIFDFILLILSTYYVAIILSKDLISGPRNSLSWLRGKLGLDYDEYGQPTAPPGSLAELIGCPYCSSIWIGVVFAFIYNGVTYLGDYHARWLFAPLAIAGFVVLVEELKE